MWTHFWDTCSGGDVKHKYDHIFIEAPSKIAIVVFYNRFGTNPNRISCTRCGEDYSISEGSLEQLTGYHRGCAYDKRAHKYLERQDPESASYRNYVSLEDFKKRKDCLFIYSSDIKDKEKEGDVPVQGYVREEGD